MDSSFLNSQTESSVIRNTNNKKMFERAADSSIVHTFNKQNVHIGGGSAATNQAAHSAQI